MNVAFRNTFCRRLLPPILNHHQHRSCTSSPYKPIRRPQFPADNNQAAAASKSSTSPADLNKNAATAASDKPTATTLPTLAKRLQMRIQAGGPITVAQYMREVLTNWAGGYYTSSRDVFGQQGDFITSPEIGQIFGELVAVWLYAEWQKCGSPLPLQLVELGPGRGTMVQDVLRVLSKFGLGAGKLSVRLVEISPFLSEVQAQRLCLRTEVAATAGDAHGQQQRHYRSGETVSGIPVAWYRTIEDVPADGFTVVLAHEFLDALPVHKFQLQDGKWREVMVDWRPPAADSSDEGGFHLVASKAETVMQKLFMQQIDAATEKRTHIEHSFEVQQCVEHLAVRLERDGGFALVMDYGHAGDGTDTFRAFKAHRLHDPLVDPGSADLTADVDFANVRRVCEHDDRLVAFGPVEQREFLQRLGGTERLQQLLDGAQTEEARETLRSGYAMLTDVEQMGARFKFMAMFPAVLREHLKRFPVNGFQ